MFDVGCLMLDGGCWKFEVGNLRYLSSIAHRPSPFTHRPSENLKNNIIKQTIHLSHGENYRKQQDIGNRRSRVYWFGIGRNPAVCRQPGSMPR
jgi:hypothetical protein